MADFLREVREIAAVNKKRQERFEARRLAKRREQERFAVMNGKPAENDSLVEFATFPATNSPVEEKQEVERIDERDTGGGYFSLTTSSFVDTPVG